LQPSVAAAQAEVRFINLARPLITLGETELFYGVRNNGDAESEPFRIRVWASIDREISDNDLNSMSDVIGPIQPSIGTTGFHKILFKLPLPGEDDRDFPKLVGDNREPLEWIGESIFSRACILNEAGTIELQCSETRETLVSPPTARLSVSNGNAEKNIELRMAARVDDNDQLLFDRIVFPEQYYDESGTQITNEIVLNTQDLTTIDGVLYFRQLLENRVPNRMYEYRRRLTFCLTVPAKGEICSPNFFTRTPNVGNVLGEATASNGLTGKIDVSWQRFNSPNAPATIQNNYLITRCVENKEDSCINIGLAEDSTTFSDASFASCLRLPSFFSFRMSVSNIGTIGLPDKFENDNTPSTAKIVNTSTTQLRSFDVANDVDWVRIDSDKLNSVTIQTSGPLANDTELTLYNTELEELFYNDNSERGNTLFSRLNIMELPKGTYFLKINQKIDPDPFFYRPVPNYVLSIKIGRVQISPILNLLLND